VQQLTPQFHRATLDSLDECVGVLDQDGAVVSVNAALARFADRYPDCDLRVANNYLLACRERGQADCDRAAIADALEQMLAGGCDGFALVYGTGDSAGTRRWFGVRATRFHGDGSAAVVLHHYDSTEFVEAQRAAHLRTRLLEDIDAAVWACDLDGRIDLWSRGAEAVFGWTADEVVGRDIADVVVAADKRVDVREAIDELRRDGRRISERVLLRKDGTEFFGYVSSVVSSGGVGIASGIVSVALDGSERVRAAQDLREARDHLRAVTDSMGEAVCTLDDAGHVSYLNAAAERLLGFSLAEMRGRTLHELTHYRRPDGSPYPLAECPLYGGHRGRQSVRVDDDVFLRSDGSELPVSWVLEPFESPVGANSVIVFTDNTVAKAAQERLRQEVEQLSQVRDLHEALQEQRFELFAQPIVDLGSGRTISHELLLRMRERDGSIRAPEGFLPAAEACGLIRELDRWVIDQAARLAGEGHHVELNISAASLGDPSLFDDFAAAVAAHDADPARMVVELTETAIMQDETIARTFIERIVALGCELALDDFGTGYGGFAYLKNLPVTYLKIDVEFVRDIRTNPASRHVVQAVVGLAAAFGHRTVAEGVEDDETLALISDMGVDLAQGYGIGRPGPLDETLYAV
jgi:PAS domain S-box-containing protein